MAAVMASSSGYPSGGGSSSSGAPKQQPQQREYSLQDFQTIRDLGNGSFGVVRQVVHKDTAQIFAMKVLDKRRVMERDLEEQLKREVLIQLKANHPNVVRMLYYFEDEDHVHCLLEYADKGQLFAYLRRNVAGLPEARAAQFFHDAAAGLAYLHGLGVAHRDVKPENILLFGENLRAKLGDLGWCVELTAERPDRHTFCGTTDYLSPEMLLNEPHDTSVDLWALGVLLFEMLVARAPFAAPSQKEAIERICAARVEIPSGTMSIGAQELTEGLLKRRQRDRMPLSKVLQHPWVTTLAGTARPGASLDDTCVVERRRGAAAAAAAAEDLDGTHIVQRKNRPNPCDGRDDGAGVNLDDTRVVQRPARRPAGGAEDPGNIDATKVVQRRHPSAASASGAGALLPPVQEDGYFDAGPGASSGARRGDRRGGGAAAGGDLLNQTMVCNPRPATAAPWGEAERRDKGGGIDPEFRGDADLLSMVEDSAVPLDDLDHMGPSISGGSGSGRRGGASRRGRTPPLQARLHSGGGPGGASSSSGGRRAGRREGDGEASLRREWSSESQQRYEEELDHLDQQRQERLARQQREQEQRQEQKRSGRRPILSAEPDRGGRSRGGGYSDGRRRGERGYDEEQGDDEDPDQQRQQQQQLLMGRAAQVCFPGPRAKPPKQQQQQQPQPQQPQRPRGGAERGGDPIADRFAKRDGGGGGQRSRQADGRHVDFREEEEDDDDGLGFQSAGGMVLDFISGLFGGSSAPEPQHPRARQYYPRPKP